MYRDVLGFSITPFMQRVMNINGFFASIMRTGKKTEGSKDTLPPGVPIPILPVDYLKDRPANWIGGEGSYVCPVDSDWGLWFNFTMNNPANTAVLSSVKGMNPITGQRVGGYELEEYQDKCPVHKKPFSKGKLCTECGFKWPFQNYLAYPGKMWLDGWRMPDGNVRQFYFTEEMVKSIPELCIGRDDVVPAFGFAFYKLKEYDGHSEEGKHVKDKFPADLFSYGVITTDGLSSLDMCKSADAGIYGISTKGFMSGGGGTISASSYMYRSSGMNSIKLAAESPTTAYFASCSNTASVAKTPTAHNSAESGSLCEKTVSSEYTFRDYGMPEPSFLRKSAEVGVAAGEKIRQSFDKSSQKIEAWEKKPAGVIRLYFVFQEEFEKYASAGFNNLEGNETGYLEGLPVGGSHE